MGVVAVTFDPTNGTSLTEIIWSVRKRIGDFPQNVTQNETGDGTTVAFRLRGTLDEATGVTCTVAAVTSVEDTDFTVDYDSNWLTFGAADVPADAAAIIFTYKTVGWADERIQEAINASIDQLFSNFYVEGVNATTLETDGEGELQVTTDDPTDLGPEDRITRVEFDNGDRWVKLENWSVRRTATKKYIVWQNAPVEGYPLRVTYVVRPANLDSGAQLLETTAGLPARAKEPLVDYACAELLGDPLARRILSDMAHNTQNENAVKSYDIVNAANVFYARAVMKAGKLKMEPLKSRLQT